jgi:hypothetical protein
MRREKRTDGTQWATPPERPGVPRAHRLMRAVLLASACVRCAPAACTALAVAVTLWACANPRGAQVSSAGDVAVRSEGNDDSSWFFISCPKRGTSCTQTAGLLCPDGYRVVNVDGYEIPASLRGLPEVQDGALRVRCVPSFILGGR